MFRSILVAVDGSEEGRFAVAQAARLARADGARLTVLTVLGLRRTPGMPEYARVRIRLDLEDEARALLEDALADVPEDIPTDARVAWGGVEEEILAEVEAHGHDLLVVGSRGRGRVRASLLGSIGLAMLRRCPVPVLIAHAPSERSAAGSAGARSGALPVLAGGG